MKRIATWYRNLALSPRVILSLNTAIFVCIFLISIFATLNRIAVQKREASGIVINELSQVANLLNFLQDKPISDLEPIIKPRLLFDTGFISIVNLDGDVLICRERQGKNIAGTPMFTELRKAHTGEYIYYNPQIGDTEYQYHSYFEPLGLYITATIRKKEFIDSQVRNTLRIMVIALIFSWSVFTIVIHFIMKSISVPVKRMRKVLGALGKGDLSEEFSFPYKDELGQMVHSLNELQLGLRQTAAFAAEIGKNNFDFPFKPMSEKDTLGNALIEMRQSLKIANDEERLRKLEDEKRNWTTQGLARFAEILRQNNNNINELSYDIIKNLVEYLGINQGGIFILNENTETKEKWLELTACYAYDRRKYLDKKVIIGEGLVGTCFLEKEPIYITKVPQDYIRITSGLGDENPSSLLLIPLKLNDEIYGVIELASFHQFEKYRIEFVEKIGESIASTISSVKINIRTALLLQKSQQQAEEMRAQEEEMRQNMEELHATQEAMAEKERENLRTIDELTAYNNSLRQEVDELNARISEFEYQHRSQLSPQTIPPVAEIERTETTMSEEDADTLQWADDDGLHQSKSTENQKAWSEHITQKGKTFRKSKKK